MKQIDLYLIEKLKINKYTSSYISSDKYGVEIINKEATRLKGCGNCNQTIRLDLLQQKFH